MTTITSVYAFQRAAGARLQHNPKLLEQAVDHCQEEVEELVLAFRAFNDAKDPEAIVTAAIELVDAAIDLRYVACNVMHFLGIPAVTAIAASEDVHQCNMEKVFPRAVRDANGKILKPAGWHPPRHSALREWLSNNPIGGDNAKPV